MLQSFHLAKMKHLLSIAFCCKLPCLDSLMVSLTQQRLKCFSDPGRLMTMRRAHKFLGECSDKLNYPGAKNIPGQDIRTAESSVSYDFDMRGLRWVVSHRRWYDEEGMSANVMKGIENH